MLGNLPLAMLAPAGSALAQDEPANAPAPAPVKVEMTTPVFEMFCLAPGKTEAFIRSMAVWDQVSIAGGQPRNVRIVGNRFDAISAGDIPAPAGATVIDGAGQTLMPGLTDAHWHMSAVKGVPWMGSDDGLAVALILKDAEFQLMRGFTTVRDTAGSVFGIKAAIDRGVVPGPRCYPSGAAISQTSGHGDPGPVDELPATLGGEPSGYQRSGMTAVANGVPEVLAATRQQLMRGASQIKIMGGGGVTSDHDPIDTLQFTPEEMRAIVQVATDWGAYACAHAYTPAGVRRCLDAGVLSIEHGHAIDDTTAALMAEKGAWLSVQPFEPGDNVLTSEQQVKAQESIGAGGWHASVRLGVIEEDAWADMLLVRGNPLDDLRLLEDFERNLLVIIKDGVIHKNLLSS